MAKKNYLEHKDRNVRSLVACCIADILRINAPDSPYSVHENKASLALPIDPFRCRTIRAQLFFVFSSFLLRTPVACLGGGAYREVGGRAS